MSEHPAITKLRRTAPDASSSLPWSGDRGRVYHVFDANGVSLCTTHRPEDAEYIVAAVNAAPVLLAELGALRARLALGLEDE